MLTEEILNAQECLVTLTDEQKQTIIKASENDENEVMGKKLGEVHRQYDADVEGSTGIKRNGDEKTYDYVKRVGSMLKGENDDLRGKLSHSEERIKELEASIEKGGDSALKEKYEAIVNELASTKACYSELKSKSEEAEANYGKALNDYKIESEINYALSRIELKKDLNEAVKNALIERVKSEIKTKKPIFEERGGKSVLVYHNEDGTPIVNMENKLEPFTTEEMLRKSFEGMDLLERKNNRGAGGREEKPQRSIVNASTKMEADQMISRILAEKGLMRGTQEYQDEYNRLWTEGKVSQLPTR